MYFAEALSLASPSMHTTLLKQMPLRSKRYMVAYVDVGADALKENNAFLRGLFAIHVLPRHCNVNQTLLLNSRTLTL